ncbi:phage tail terminator protein [Sporosarcina psychrophila]|uniref:phage tail terminator protein n=1 Tax=Sporosarcina psychrophila TaxID=1476 RepID=UPI00078DBA3C|nr:minor capsid protein [Sporosarcina psychrophila]AMQ06731.1 capsid protein [Sporosarcina psychrophila]
MDFMERLCDKINSFPGLQIPCKLGYLGASESFVLYPLPGSRVTQEYMDGTTDQQLNYEIAFKSKFQNKINDTLWSVQTELEKTKKIISGNGSFEFDELVITNKPFINHIDEQGWFVFLLNVQAKITVFKEEK